MKRLAISTAALAALFTCAPLHAADEDGQAWAAATATISVSDKAVVWLEGQTRFYDDAGRLGQVLLRPGVGWRINASDTAFVGYAYVTTDQPGRANTREHRIWQQLLFRAAGDGAGLTLIGRTRFEQRFLEGSGDMGLRLRQMARLTAPLAGKVRAVGWAEAFVALDNTEWGQRSGFDRVRSFAGVTVPVAGGVAVEPGYMNEFVNARGRNRMNHIVSITLNTTF